MGRYIKTNAKQRIIKAAINLLWRHGYKGTTTKMIASEAGVNEVTIFRHFKNKDNLIIEIFKNFESFPPTGDFFEKDYPSVEIFFNAFIHDFFKRHLTNRFLFLLCLKELGNEKSVIVKMYIDSIRSIIELFNKKLEKISSREKINPINIKDASYIFHSVLISSIIWHAAHEEEIPLKELKRYIKNITNIIIHGCKGE